MITVIGIELFFFSFAEDKIVSMRVIDDSHSFLGKSSQVPAKYNSMSLTLMTIILINRVHTIGYFRKEKNKSILAVTID
jgi:hypothetical protein